MLGWLEWRWLWGIYSLQQPIQPLGRLSIDGRIGQSGAPPDTVWCATGHCPVRQPRHPTVRVLMVSTVGALTSWATGQCGAAPDRNCSLSGVPSGAALTLRELSAHCSRCRRPLELTVVSASRCSAGTPDSPVAHWIVR
jgi:hypothetical protein